MKYFHRSKVSGFSGSVSWPPIRWRIQDWLEVLLEGLMGLQMKSPDSFIVITAQKTPQSEMTQNIQSKYY